MLGFFRRGGESANFIFMGVGIFLIETQAFPRRRLVRRRLVSGDGGCLSNFSRPERGRTQIVTNGGPFSACFSNVLRRRLVAAPLPLIEATPATVPGPLSLTTLS